MAGKNKDEFESGAEEDLFDDDEGGSEEEVEIEEPIETGEEIDVEPAPSRREKRRNRLAERAADEAERRIQSAMDARLSGIEQMLRNGVGNQQQERRQGPSPEIANVDSRLEECYGKQDMLQETYLARTQAGDLTAEERAKFRKDARKLQEEAQELTAVRTAIKMGLGRPQDSASMEQEIIRTQTRARHSDIYSHPDVKKLTGYASAYYNMQISLGAQDGQDLQDKSMDAARKQFGMQTKFSRDAPAPTRESRSQMSGPRSSGGGSFGGTGNGKRKVVVTKAMRDISAVAYPHITDERKRIEHHVRMVQKKG